MRSLTIDCALPPFQIPHFVKTAVVLYTEFPRKYDFLIADIDGNGTITTEDQALWSNYTKVKERLKQLSTMFPFAKDTPLAKDTWWRDPNIVVTTTFDSESVSLPWNDDWTLKFTLPKEYADLQMTLMFLAANQPRFLNEIENVRKNVNDVLQSLQTTGVDLLPEGQRMRDRLEHVYRTYRRL